MHARPKLSLIILLIPPDYAAWLSIQDTVNTCSRFHESGRKGNIFYALLQNTEEPPNNGYLCDSVQRIEDGINTVKVQ